jgi:hypothetical protein
VDPHVVMLAGRHAMRMLLSETRGITQVGEVRRCRAWCLCSSVHSQPTESGFHLMTVSKAGGVRVVTERASDGGAGARSVVPSGRPLVDARVPSQLPSKKLQMGAGCVPIAHHTAAPTA